MILTAEYLLHHPKIHVKNNIKMGKKHENFMVPFYECKENFYLIFDIY